MVVCKFFLEGYCRFGNRCKFEHDDYSQHYDLDRTADLSGDRQSGVSILKASNTSFGSGHNFSNQDYSHSSFQGSQHHSHSSFQGSQQHISQTLGSKFSVHDVMQAVNRDIVQAESGNQWKLSVYSPQHGLPNVPGLEDNSPEELRWECYKAAQDGSIQLWQAIVQQLFANVVKVNNELKKKDTGFNIIDRWLRSVEDKKTTNSTSFSQINSVSPFGESTSPFVSGNVSAGLGSGFTTPAFGDSQQTSVGFGTANTLPGFGSTNSPQTFFGASSFGSQGLSVNNAPPSMFGGSSPVTSTNSSPFFAQSDVQSNNSSFSFSLPQQQPLNPLQISPNNSATNSNRTIFSSSPSASPFSLSFVSSTDDQNYSKIEELKEVELNNFRAEKFTFKQIPTKPPPKAMCFKT